MEQPTLTDYYSAKKRPSEGIHPAKRRKLIQIESVAVISEKTRRENVKIAPQRTKTRATSKSAQGSTRRTRNVAKNAQSSRMDAFLSVGMKESSTDVEKVGIEVTSVSDDHDLPIASLNVAPCQKSTSTTRRRKTGHRMQEPTEPAGSKDEICEEKVVLKAHSTRRSQRATTLTNETQTKPQVTTKASTEVKASDVESNKQGIDKTTSKQSILFQAKSPIRSTPVGLKINPWIADQANKVLLSRGQAALLLSQQKSAAVQGNRASKTKSHKPKEDAKNTLSKTKAQEGLEKARELIKKLRTLESDASKSKETSTSDKTERLHKLAKRQSSDGTSAESLSSSPKKTPAFERFHSLAQPSEATVTLPLPYKYKGLGEMFTCCDTILNLLGQRNETCTFDKLKECVQQMSRKRFEKKNLAQMMAVLPNSYDVQQVRNNARRKSFQDKLLVITKKHHQVFLKTLEVPLSIDDEKIIRWHPQFKLDDVPDIEQSVLPEAPEIKIYTTAQDVLDRGLGLMAPKVEKALKNVALKSKEKPKLDITYDSQPKGENNQVKNKNSKNSGVLKGISQDLLNKIRQKEAKKLEEKMMRDPILDKKMIMQERLPELCRILKTYFTAEKKAAIPLEDVTVKLSESYKSSLTPVQIEEHLRLLSELAPEWFSVLLVRKCPYVKINKKTDINTVIKKVTQKEIK